MYLQSKEVDLGSMFVCLDVYATHAYMWVVAGDAAAKKLEHVEFGFDATHVEASASTQVCPGFEPVARAKIAHLQHHPRQDG